MSGRLAKRVLVIGWDAADWKIIGPLLSAGEMPALKGLVSRGASGDLASMWPMESPLLWTTIATGKRPYEHGITHFVEPDPTSPSGMQPIRSFRRQCKALWNILTQAELRSTVIGWYASHPAEPINGVVVSDSYRNRPELMEQAAWPLAPRTVHPERLADQVASLRVHPRQLTLSHLLPFVPEASTVDQSQDMRLHSLAQELAECASTHNAALWLMENEPWDFCAIYYPALDKIGHQFMHYYPPRIAEVPEPDFQLYQHVMAATYRYHDAMLQQLLDMAGPETTVIICSDHGFHSGAARPRDFGQQELRKGEDWHREQGILCLQGPGIKQHAVVQAAHILDITPLVLTLFGLPVGEDMGGKIPDVFGQVIQPQRIASWEDVPGECGMSKKEDLEEAWDAEQAVQQLVSLGYIDTPGQDKQETARKILNDSKYHVACSLAESGQDARAVEILEQLVLLEPDDEDNRCALSRSYWKLHQYDRSRQALEDLRTAQDDWSPATRSLLGEIELAEGNASKAIVHFEAAHNANIQDARLQLNMGASYAELAKWQEALSAYARALELDPQNALAHTGLAEVLLNQGRNADAAHHAVEAARLMPELPDGHYYQGIALAKLGKAKRAAEALELCLLHAPPPLMATGAHDLLAQIHERVSRNAKKAAKHRELARQLAAAAQVDNGVVNATGVAK